MPATVTSISGSPKKPMSNDRGLNHILVDGDGLNNIMIQVQEFKVGAAFGKYHLHEHTDNVFFVIDGTLKAVVDGETHLLQPGDLIFIPAGSPHKAIPSSGPWRSTRRRPATTPIRRPTPPRARRHEPCRNRGLTATNVPLRLPSRVKRFVR
jgi:mannose-6-phosphate isomerase-like protein (cupin superfamily)